MRVNTKQAVKLFFTNPSLEQVFKEAIANSLDANATKIDVRIFIDSLEKQETLQIEITDNGEGFTSTKSMYLYIPSPFHTSRNIYFELFESVFLKSQYLKLYLKNSASRTSVLAYAIYSLASLSYTRG